MVAAEKASNERSPKILEDLICRYFRGFAYYDGVYCLKNTFKILQKKSIIYHVNLNYSIDGRSFKIAMNILKNVYLNLMGRKNMR